MTPDDVANRMTASVRVHRDGNERRDPEQARARDPVAIVIFGASGDLSKRKLIPALYHLDCAGYLPERYTIVGFARTKMTDETYRESMLRALKDHGGHETQAVGADHPLLAALHYHAGSNDDLHAFEALKEKLEILNEQHELCGNRLFYLSVAPVFFPVIIRNLRAAGLVYEKKAKAWSRVIIEKPFGRDLQSALELNAAVTAALDEGQIYRIDHYLGKETVQNILSFRFGNSIFEPLFSHKYIDHVQVTVAETLGMEGHRGTYYDSAGTLRDMVQNHMLQLLCLIAMEPPSALDSQAIRDEKVKVLRAVVPLTRDAAAASTVRGQYGVGEQAGNIVKGYRQEDGVDPQSMTETYVALRLKIDNWRWAGVPFFLRSGKRLRTRVSEIAVQFKQPPMQLFRELAQANVALRPRSNWLVIRIQPDEGISLSFACKRPGMQVALEEVNMDFIYRQAFQQRSPEAYERLLLDALRGDPSLFTRSDEVQYAWRFITSIHQGWAALPPPAFPNYYPFTDGPEGAHRLMAGLHAPWRPLSTA
ncbi:MAG: glucose-6-phosphate dehydrogenase [Candidatus Binatia bacterium]